MSLVQQESLLVMKRHKLRLEREQYLQTLSVMSGKKLSWSGIFLVNIVKYEGSLCVVPDNITVVIHNIL